MVGQWRPEDSAMCLPRCGDCAGGPGESCGLLPANDEWVGEAGLPGVCDAGLWS